MCNCFGAGNKQVYPEHNEAEYMQALQSAEELLISNASKVVTDIYSLEADIGQGAFARVVRCVHKETGSKYACKIAPCFIGQQDRHSMVIKEIAIMRQIGMHPNTLSCYDAYKDATSYYMIMELCTGGELFDLIVHKELNEKQTAHMMRCLVDFLAFMHSRGIMHRDLKPENILMSSKEKDATIRVVDFGTADFCAPNQRLFDKFGTVLYVAPEVLGSAGHQCSCDIWSAGVIVYILLAGYPPFNGPNERVILRQIKRGQYTFSGTQWDGISPEAKQSIKSMLAFKPSRRATAVQLLQQDWFKQAKAALDKARAQMLLHTLSVFASMPHSQRLVIFLLACTLPEQETRHLKEHFWHLDQDKDGKLGLQDVQQALATGCIRIPPEEDVIAIFNAADITHTSRLDFANFAAVMVEKHHYARCEALVHSGFHQLDQNKDGYISEDDLVCFSHLKGVPQESSEIGKIFLQHTTQVAGKVDLAEFKAMVQGVGSSAVGRTQSMPLSFKAWVAATAQQP